MPKAIVLHEYGDAEVLRLRRSGRSAGTRGNSYSPNRDWGSFHDIYVRSGLYKTLDLPGTPVLRPPVWLRRLALARRL